jgi:hypothetical protein
VAVFASLSCSIGAVGADQKPTDTPQPAAPARATAPAPTSTVPAPAAKIPTQPEAKPIPTVPSLGDITSNTGNIDSFSMALVYHAEGKDDQGNPYKQDFTFAEDSIKSKKSDHFKISGMSALLGMGSGDLDIYEFDTSMFMYSAAQNDQKASCLALSGDKTTFDPNTMNPATLMKDITVDQLIAKGEMVNGVLADHYTVKNADIGFGTGTSQSGVTSQSGEVWLAQDGGYAVKFTGQAQGSFNLISTFTGTVTWTYDVKDINRVASIDLPPECSIQQNSQSDLVFPPNATGLSQLGQMTVFSSPDKPTDVSSFFQTNLPAKGWTVDSVNDSLGSVITIQISKAGQKMQIMITGDGSSGSSVIITPVE